MKSEVLICKATIAPVVVGVEQRVAARTGSQLTPPRVVEVGEFTMNCAGCGIERKAVASDGVSMTMSDIAARVAGICPQMKAARERLRPDEEVKEFDLAKFRNGASRSMLAAYILAFRDTDPSMLEKPLDEIIAKRKSKAFIRVDQPVKGAEWLETYGLIELEAAERDDMIDSVYVRPLESPFWDEIADDPDIQEMVDVIRLQADHEDGFLYVSHGRMMLPGEEYLGAKERAYWG